MKRKVRNKAKFFGYIQPLRAGMFCTLSFALVIASGSPCPRLHTAGLVLAPSMIASVMLESVEGLLCCNSTTTGLASKLILRV